MKTTWKKFLSLVLAVSVLSTLLVPAMAAGEGEPEQVRNAVLYQINGDGELEYNVTHKAMIADNVAITGDAAITTPDDLKSALGTADHGAAVLGTDIGTRTLGEKAYYADLTLTGGVITGIAITDAVERPIIGISWKKDEVGQDYQGFAEAYERNGAYAVFLPQVTDAQGARNVLASLDGIFMTGGEDWGTELYGEEVTPHGTSGVNEARDTSDIAYMQQAVKMGVPLFAVCRGAQGFNVAMGGKLIQDIPYYFGQKLLNHELDPALVTGVATGKIPEDLEGYELLPDEVKSASVEDQDHPDDPHLRIYVDGNIHGGMDSTGYHALKGGILNNSVAIDPESRLAEILGKPELDNVATAHHQAIDPENLGDDLKVVAQASDGIVEGIEYTGTDENGEETFALAVQWHPERDALADTRGVDVDQDECNALLRALVTEAQKHAGNCFTEDAVLYQITAGNVLEFNVTHSAPLASDVSVSGMEGITSAYNLQTALGNVDHPAAVHGTDVGSRTLPAQAYYADVRVEDGQVTEISNLKAVDRPVIGISWKSDKIGSDYEGFAEAYERNGAYAVFLPQVTSAEEARTVLAKLDGIFMTGGEDWGTELYGEEVTPHGASGVNEARDTSNIAYMQQAVKMGVPLFAVCRGEQGFNIAMGGGLIQDIPYYFGQKIIRGEMSATRISSVLTGKIPTTARDYTELPEELKEASGEDKDHPDNPCLRVTIDGVVHSGGLGYHKLAPGQSNSQVAIDPGSKLHEILGVDSISTVATAHHQAVNPDRLGDNLKIVARSSDGIVEGLEYTGKDENGKDTFALAVQWHPERDALRDTRGVNVDQDTCNVLLRALVTEAQKHDSATTTDTTTTVTNPDGSSVTTTTTASGIVGETVKDRNGTITSAKATIPAAVAVGLVRIPVDTEPGTPVSITITGGGSAYIAIPTASPNSGTVAVNGDGSVIRDGVVLDGCVVIRVTDSASVTIRNNSKQFTDSASHWAADSINFIAARDLFRGTGDGTTFSPDMQMNRGMLVTVLYRLANEPEGGTATFTDVPAGQYYTDAVAWAGTNQVVNGTGDGTFAPLQNITREQLVTILYRYADASSTGTSIGGYADASSVSSWAVDAMNWAVNTGLVTGVSGNRLNPQGLASRAEVATIFMRFITSLVR